MQLLEFQAKRLFTQAGIRIPHGKLLDSNTGVNQLEVPVVLKSQVPVGGRGKAGGIQLIKKTEDLATAASQLFKLKIKGFPVRAILAEEQIVVDRELYLAVLYNKKTNLPMIMASSVGGVDIEQVARDNPAAIFRKDIDPLVGLRKPAIGYLAKWLGVTDAAALGSIVERLYTILMDFDATLVEINPLGQTPAGLVAMDAKIVLDDKAAFRHAELFDVLRSEEALFVQADRTPAERLAHQHEVTYVPLPGNIGMISDGAGTGMLTLDMIADEGGQAANFCEMGGLSNADTMERSIEIVLANPSVRVLLITLIGGLTRMDEMGEGVARYVRKHGDSVPIVVRMCGTREAEGKASLKSVGIEAFDDMASAVRFAVKTVQSEGV